MSAALLLHFLLLMNTNHDILNNTVLVMLGGVV